MKAALCSPRLLPALIGLLIFSGCTSASAIRFKETPMKTEPIVVTDPAKSTFGDLLPLTPGVIPGDVFPTVVHQPRPIQPRDPLHNLKNGDSVVEFVVETDGTVRHVNILSETEAVFGAAAVDSIKQWRFKPATKQGVPVRCAVTLPFTFRDHYTY